MDKGLRVGTASWNIPKEFKDKFPVKDSLLESYAQVFNFVEINSSFYRSHQKKTYAKWASLTPEDFLFSVKMPKTITHQQCLLHIDLLLEQFLDEISGLQKKLAVVLIQLPPSLKFEPQVATEFFKLLTAKTNTQLALEARHQSWFTKESTNTLKENAICQVIADPPVTEMKSTDTTSFQYFRLHGSPAVYSSAYSKAFLQQLKAVTTSNSYVVFDNTKLGAATLNALDLMNSL